MPNRTLLLLVLMCVLPTTIKPVNADDPADGPITPDQPIDLFNGEDLDGWVFDIRGEGVAPEEVFTVEDGILKNAGQPVGVIRTEHDYRDYEIEVQWRWPKNGGNSGLLIHCSSPRQMNVWPKSLEVQLAANNAGDFWVIGETIAVKDPETRTRGRRTRNYTDGSEHELGQWNTMIVQVRGDTVRVEVNGDLVNEAWDCSVSSGAICLQSEGTPIEYRKVQVRPISDRP